VETCPREPRPHPPGGRKKDCCDEHSHRAGMKLRLQIPVMSRTCKPTFVGTTRGDALQRSLPHSHVGNIQQAADLKQRLRVPAAFPVRGSPSTPVDDTSHALFESGSQLNVRCRESRK